MQSPFNNPTPVPRGFNKNFQKKERKPLVKGRVKRGYAQKVNASNLKHLNRGQRGR